QPLSIFGAKDAEDLALREQGRDDAALVKAKERVRQVREAIEDRVEVFVLDLEEEHLFERLDGRRPRLAGEERELAEAIAVGERRQIHFIAVIILAVDEDAPPGDDREALSRIAFAHDHRARRDPLQLEE